MKDYSVVETERKKIIIHKVDSGGVRPVIYTWSAVRAGLSWPTPGSPGFHIVIGEEYRDKTPFGSVHRGKLKVFAESDHQTIFLDDMFKILTDDCALYHCDKVYTDLSEEHRDEAELFREFSYSGEIRMGTLNEAPYFGNFALGVSLIKRWQDNGLLVLPEKSLVRKELRILTKEDLAETPEIKYPGINALRFAVAAFEKFKASSGMFRPNRRKQYEHRINRSA